MHHEMCGRCSVIFMNYVFFLLNLTILYGKYEAAALGEALLSYRIFHIPGIDMLCDWRELTTANEYRLTRTGILVSPHIAWISAPSDL